MVERRFDPGDNRLRFFVGLVEVWLGTGGVGSWVKSESRQCCVRD